MCTSTGVAREREREWLFGDIVGGWAEAAPDVKGRTLRGEGRLVEEEVVGSVGDVGLRGDLLSCGYGVVRAHDCSGKDLAGKERGGFCESYQIGRSECWWFPDRQSDGTCNSKETG